MIEVSIRYNTRQSRKNYAGTIFKAPTLTLPNQAMTINEILNRFTRGQSFPSNQNPVYNDNEELIPFQKMDKFEKLDAIKNLQSYIEENKKNIVPPQNGQATQATEGASNAATEGAKVQPSGDTH